MGQLDFKGTEEKLKPVVDSQAKTSGTIHTILSTIALVVIALSSPLIIWSLVYSYDLLIAVGWVIASIIVSRILIYRKRFAIAYAVLFSSLVVAWLFLVRDTW